MPINPPPRTPKPTMSFDGIQKFIPARSAALLPVPRRGAHDPGECHGCGAPLQAFAVDCAWCKRPTGHPDHLGQMIEVTSLDDPAPRYVAGWMPQPPPWDRPPRPLPPPSRLVTESGRDMTGVLTVGYGISDVNRERIRRSFAEAYSRGGAVVLEGPRRQLSLLARLVRAVWPR